MQQTITFLELIKLIGVIAAIIGSFYSVVRIIQLRNKEYATKEFVMQEVKLVDEKIKSVEEKQKDSDSDIKYIRGRLDELFDYLLKSKAS